MKLTALQIKQIEDKSRLMTMRHAAESMGLTLNQIDHACRKHGISFKKTGERHHSAKVSDEDIELIRQLHDEGIGVAEISEKFEMNSGTVSKIVNYVDRQNG